MAAMATLFDRLNKERPAPGPEAKKPHSDAQKMLDWLMRWPKPTVSACEIYQYGPHSIRPDRERAIKSAEVLVRHGWLTALKTRQRNYRIWEITRRPIVNPKIAE